jgi:hypothetical protein
MLERNPLFESFKKLAEMVLQPVGAMTAVADPVLVAVGFLPCVHRQFLDGSYRGRFGFFCRES